MHEGRNQYVLDMGRDDVVAYLTDVFTAVLGSADIKYIKWDMNRNISDANSAALPPNRQGEVMHRYILGVYKLMENLVSTFPNILFEGLQRRCRKKRSRNIVLYAAELGKR